MHNSYSVHIFSCLHASLTLCSIPVTMNKQINIIFHRTYVILASATAVNIFKKLHPPATSALIKPFYCILLLTHEKRQ